MAKRTLVIGNKNYSSWSLRPWLALRMAGIDFEEVRISLYVSGARQEILRHSPAGRVPVLLDGDRTVFDSLAICEYAAELAPAAELWPADAGMRAYARSISAEMHSGFAALRHTMHMNLRVVGGRLARQAPPEALADIERVTSIFADCRARFGAGGPFLFGGFTIADAMFAPVVTRFRTYSVLLPPIAQAYTDAVVALAPLQEWTRDARTETERIAETEALLA